MNQKVGCYDEIHLVFDRYDLPTSLKETTRARCLGSQTAISYKVTDNTPIANVPLKKFLSHTKTKDQLAEYLAHKVVEEYQSSEKTVIVAYKGTVISNGEVNHLKSSHEEADTKLILHARDTTIHGAKVLDILSPDTDVFILALRRFPLLASTTQFVTGTGSPQDMP